MRLTRGLPFVLCLLLTPSLSFAHDDHDHEVKPEEVSRREVTDATEKAQWTAAKEALAEYNALAMTFLAQLSELDQATVQTHATQLVELSDTVLMGASLRLPQCNDYFDAVRAVVDKLDTITLEQMEADYHQDGALPASPDECYHAKDLLVHAATVLVLNQDLNDETRAEMNKEIGEVLGHVAVVDALIFQ